MQISDCNNKPSFRQFSTAFRTSVGLIFLWGSSSLSFCQEPASPSRLPTQKSESDPLTGDLIKDLLGPDVSPKSTRQDEETEKSSDPTFGMIHRDMIAAASVLMQGDVGPRSIQMQSQILSALDELIDQMRKESQEQSRQQQSSQKSQSQSQSAGQQSSSAKFPTSIPDEKDSQSQQVVNGNQPGESQIDSGKTEINLADAMRLGEGVWGHLPERVRRQMIASGAVKFLPKYQKLIEQYYRRIADDNVSTTRKNPN